MGDQSELGGLKFRRQHWAGVGNAKRWRTGCDWNWYPHPELNGDPRFRKPLLYPFELWGQPRKRS
jgi:hypothetical protein